MNWNPLLSDLIVESYLAERRERAARAQPLRFARAKKHLPPQRDARHLGRLRGSLSVALALLGNWVANQRFLSGPATETSCSRCSTC